MKTLKITVLEEALQYWEDANLFGELMFQCGIKNVGSHKTAFGPLVGSEVTRGGWLGRKIENFELLRKDLELGSIQDPSVYLPRISKEYK